ncbi:hypothetical protein RRX38_19430 [Pseudomonas sp. DTU_2021_1001937_2_SI_NGA_ILE_001]|uniref:hypothetical protein n=1 Tax=Pseudomonas sp. DTU_2021_1001937_2_SI_NGA_ILE_001 TaxID=3077589 RepID=UPI0028FC0DD6|nr:hypothetical protein [Pseudomonas sp. DTU_2021_1001937_2_SI_NGA_ILE_001]WNW13236.1 hypothetical protein RRX38_19430 [Pseudomonas sp. DTU_2021_1001937_2_SI_NGA_ILE_001]
MKYLPQSLALILALAVSHAAQAADGAAALQRFHERGWQASNTKGQHEAKPEKLAQTPEDASRSAEQKTVEKRKSDS